MISLQDIHPGLHKTKPQFRSRKGTVAVLAAVLMIFMLAMLAFAIDIGYLVSAKTEMQRTADSAALAAAWELINDDFARDYSAATDSAVRSKAAEYAAKNKVIKTSPTLDLATDVSVGYLHNPADRTEQISFLDPGKINTVKVRVRYTDEQNRPVPFFFAPLLGMDSQGLSVEAAAAFSLGKVVGFTAPKGNSKSTVMPFAIKTADWSGLIDGAKGTDSWAYDPVTGTVAPGRDGIREIKMYPAKDLGDGVTVAPGNFGTVDIGSADNSTYDVWRQILNGPNADDYSHLQNGALELDPQTGKLYLNGDTGLSASIGMHALQYVVGLPRTILLYENVQDPGNNATFTITGFAGVRVVSYRLQGVSPYVLIQPAVVVDNGAVVGDTNASYFVGPPVQLVR